MSEQKPTEVRYTFRKVKVNYSTKNLHIQRTPDSSKSETVDTPPTSTWFDRLDIIKNHSADCSPSHIIDVQPDFRYPLAYIIYSTKELYANAILNQQETHTSIFTFIYYCQSLVVATLLFYDLYSRPQKSCHAAPFLSNAPRSILSDLVFESRVPNFMAQILSHLCPAFDANQPHLLYVPTLAAFSFQHDLGRLVPPGIFLVANSITCETQDANPMEVLRQLYSSKIVSIAGEDHYITNFLGGPYMDGDEVCDRPNWIREGIEYFVSSGVGARENSCHFSPLKYAHERDLNPYDLMFGFNDANYRCLLKIFRSVSHFLQEKEPSSLSLGNLLSSPSGLTIMSHFYSSPTLPTCHSLPPPPPVYNKEHIFVDDAQFAGKVQFLSNPSSGTQPQVQFSPLGFERFDRYVNVRGDIFGFQPYGQDVESLGVALTLGLTIENGDIDGVTISQPNLRLSLCDNHSYLLQGALPVKVVRPYIPNFEPGNKLVIFKRADHSSYPNNPVGFARGDMGRIIPMSGDQAVANINVNVNGGCYTYMAWNRSDEVLPIPDSSVYFWSSYRYVHNNAKDCDIMEVYFYFTLKALYGNVVNMTKLKCPSWLFP